MFTKFLIAYSLSINVIGLFVCFYCHIQRPRRAWALLIGFLLATLLSNYYWDTYEFLMDDYPSISSILAYLGWNTSYLFLAQLVLHMRSEDERGFFSPWCLLPIPLNIAQFILYLPFGGILNNIWQGVTCTFIACAGLNSLLWWLVHRDRQFPRIALFAVLFVISEYVMWTSSCFDAPILYDTVYNIAAMVFYVMAGFMVWTLYDTYHSDEPVEEYGSFARMRRVLPVAYYLSVLSCFFGGYQLTRWMRDVIDASIIGADGSDPYAILAVVLFVTAAVVVLMSTAIIVLFRNVQQADERNALRQAKAIAEHSNEAKSQFLAQMSHEIRTPLNAVLGMNEMILRESTDEAILDYATGIQTAGRTLLSLINSILDFSKIEEGRMEIVPVEYDTSSFINNLVASVAERAKAKGLRLVVEVDESLPSLLYGDDVRLSQVITNILTNAVKYTECGEVHFSIAGGARREGSIELEVAVQDTGIGIREEDLPRLFESFERLDEERNRNIEGTGLGMAIVTKLLDMMGSELQVESVYGKGSTFSFAVWQEVVDDRPIGDYAKRLEASHGGGNETLLAEGAKVLVVDDNDMNLKVAWNLLKLFAIVPDLAASGREAIECARQKTYHLILLDHMMPGMDGVETLAELRREGLVEDGTTVIAMTANAVNGAREQYLGVGFDGYLSKPVDVGKLEELLRSHLPADICHTRVAAEAQESAGAEATVDSAASPASSAADRRSGETDFVAALSELGYNTDAGLRYAAGDRDFYLELVVRFAEGVDDQARVLRACYEEGDLHDYQIRAHSLKGMARQIGADDLADRAFEQEVAAKDNDMDAIRAGVDELLRRYEATGRELTGVVGALAAEEAEPEGAATSGTIVEAPVAVAIMQEAAAAIDDFEAERAALVLQPLKDASVGNLSLHGPIDEILAALDDFDSYLAAEELGSLLSMLEDSETREGRA